MLMAAAEESVNTLSAPSLILFVIGTADDDDVDTVILISMPQSATHDNFLKFKSKQLKQ